MISVTDIEKLALKTSEPWSPVDVAYVNDQVIRMAVFHGVYHWHRHVEEDELFYVVEGSITIKVRGGEDVRLNKGQLCVIPRNVEHCPQSDEPSVVLLFEPRDLKSRGD